MVLKKTQKAVKSLEFCPLTDLKALVKHLNKQGKSQYKLIRQNPRFYLLEQDLGGEFLDYFILEIRDGIVWAASDDVMIFLHELRKKGGEAND